MEIFLINETDTTLKFIVMNYKFALPAVHNNNDLSNLISIISNSSHEPKAGCWSFSWEWFSAFSIIMLNELWISFSATDTSALIIASSCKYNNQFYIFSNNFPISIIKNYVITWIMKKIANFIFWWTWTLRLESFENLGHVTRTWVQK